MSRLNRHKRRILVLLLALVTLGSGIVNLESVIGPSLPERRAILRQFFPLEFARASAFLTLLAGFALVLSSINIYKRKRRAYQLVFALALGSVIFHLTKGLDYEEAAFSALLLGLLWWQRRIFTVASGAPNWRSAIIRFAVALAVAVGYGVAGLWLLEPREFGVNFTIGDAIRRTFLLLTFADPGMVPVTRYAHWFLRSLHLMTETALAYSAWSLFRPALYALRTAPYERERAAEITARYGRSSTDFFKYWPDKSFYFTPSGQTFIAYRVAGGIAVALGDPVGPEHELEEAVRGFRAYCAEHDWACAFHQAMPDFLEVYSRAGLQKLKIGDDAIVDLTQFNLSGRKAKDGRTKITQLEKAGIRAVLHEPPIDTAVLRKLKQVSDDWLGIPGRRERTFTLGQFDEDYLRTTRVLVAEDQNGDALAFMNLIPSFRKGEVTCDLMRRRSAAPNGVMDYLFVKLFLLLKAEGVQRFNLGMAPMSGFQEQEPSTPRERAVHTFFQHLNFVFSYKGLRAYKAKFATSWEPRYAIYRTALDLPRLALALGKVTEVKGS